MAGPDIPHTNVPTAPGQSSSSGHLSMCAVMSRKTSARTYGKKARKPLAGMPLANLDVNMTISTPAKGKGNSKSERADDTVGDLTTRLDLISIYDQTKPAGRPKTSDFCPAPSPKTPRLKKPTRKSISTPLKQLEEQEQLRTLTWEDVCQPGDQIEKIAEASYAEVYRITNDRGTSIIKAIRLASPIKPQTKAQQKSGLVDEEPHSEDDLAGELQISELLADIPGFVIYKEKYIVRGKTTPALLETHQTFHRREKRKDPDRLQFYPSPSRYLKDTQFLVIELGDAGVALEDLEIVSVEQIWDVFLGVAIALARAENLVQFEHRDLHEGNICVRQVRLPSAKPDDSICQFGYTGFDVTILDYGLSRAQDLQADEPEPISQDLERDLTLFTSTHANQCNVYRQMRSYLLKRDRIWLAPKQHNKPYQRGPYGPICWSQHHAYTNVLWLAYLYQYLLDHFEGSSKQLARFKRETREFWTHLNPEAPLEIMSFSSAEDIVEFAAEAGWVTEDQLVGPSGEEGYSQMGEESIIEIRSTRADEAFLRRSPRKRTHPTER